MMSLLEAWIERAAPSCAEVARLASEALDRRLTPRERVAMRIHFTICCFCRRYRDQLRCVREGLRKNACCFESDCAPLCGEEKARLEETCRKARG